LWKKKVPGLTKDVFQKLKKRKLCEKNKKGEQSGDNSFFLARSERGKVGRNERMQAPRLRRKKKEPRTLGAKPQGRRVAAPLTKTGVPLVTTGPCVVSIPCFGEP